MGPIYIFFVAFPEARPLSPGLHPQSSLCVPEWDVQSSTEPCIWKNYFPSKITSLLIKILPQFSYLCASSRLRIVASRKVLKVLSTISSK